MNLVGSKFKTNTRKLFFMHCLIQVWGLLSPDVTEDDSLATFKNHLDESLEDRGRCLAWELGAEPWNQSFLDLNCQRLQVREKQWEKTLVVPSSLSLSASPLCPVRHRPFDVLYRDMGQNPPCQAIRLPWW